jgi:hypothetical protein
MVSVEQRLAIENLVIVGLDGNRFTKFARKREKCCCAVLLCVLSPGCRGMDDVKARRGHLQGRFLSLFLGRRDRFWLACDG